MAEGTGLPAGSVVLLDTGEGPFPTAYQRGNDQPGEWFGVRDWWRDDVMANLIGAGRAEVVHRAPNKDEALAEFLWDLFEVPNEAEPWALADDTAQRNQVGYAKQVREFVKRQEEEGK